MTELAVPGRAELEHQLGALRPELVGYCYRMLGSPFDADDAAQETMLRAWRGLDRFEGRAALRSWLFSIATNVCLDRLKEAHRRALPMDVSDDQPASLGPPLPREHWVEPVPEDWTLPRGLDPAQVAVERESIRLAFVAALQLLAPRQRAVLLLRDVLRWRAREVADLLNTTQDAVNAVLKRARATLASAGSEHWSETAPDVDRTLLARYVDAFERFDIDALVALFHEEATLSMPPYDLTLRGLASIAAWFRSTGAACANARLVPIKTNGTAGFAQYRQSVDGRTHYAFAIHLIEVTERRISRLYTFLDPTLFDVFGLELTT
jgi:RNA polymerase sigma-70 factor (ECF subfamily)